MSKEMLNAVGKVTGEIATNAVKNTSCSMTLEGVAAAVTILGVTTIVCGTVIALVCITSKQPTTIQ